MPIQDVALKTNWEQWMIETGGKRGSGRSMMAVRHDDDDEILKKKKKQSKVLSCPTVGTQKLS